MHKIIKNWISHFYFYAKPQSYQAEYIAKITNLLSVDNQLSIILPLPLNTDYQQLKSKLVFNPQPVEIKTDPLYHNKYALWQLKLAARATQIISEKINLIVTPRAPKLSKQYYLADYRKNLDYLKPNKFISSTDCQIQQLAKKIVGTEDNILAIIKKINKYVIRDLHYANPIPGLYSANEALQKKSVDCGGFDTLLAALCMSVGIPSRIISGFWAGYTSNKMHAWVEMQLPNGTWLPADPSIENLRSKKSGKLGWLGSDRVAFSVGCDIPVEVNNKSIQLPILQNPHIISQSGNESFKMQTNFITLHE